MKAKRKYKLITRDDKIGLLFVSPFLLGFVFLFGKPMVESIIYSFHKVMINVGSVDMEFVGVENYRMLLFVNVDFIKALASFGGEVVLKIVVLVFFSMFVALLLNQKFAGRLFFRTAMFLPVIFGSEAVMNMYNRKSSFTAISLEGDSGLFATMQVGASDFLTDLMESFGFLSGIMTQVTASASGIFEFAWDAGIQIVLFIIGLQAIPSYLYEVCEIEGATKWETFWKITFPMLTPTILLCLIYTVIDSFNSGNEVMTLIQRDMQTLLHYACAETWLYSLLVFALVFVIYKLVAKNVIYLD